MANNTEHGVLIKGTKIVEDDAWIDIDDGAPQPATGNFTVSFERFTAEPGAFDSARGRLGLRLGPTDDPRTLGTVLSQIGLITVRFDKFTDGRGYSIARLLRDQLAYTAELRAVGDVLPDQVFYLRRCGFDAIALAPGKTAEHALAALEEFSVRYQAAADDPRPLYARTTR